MGDDPTDQDYSDASFEAFAGSSVTHGEELRDAQGNRVYPRWKPLSWVPIVALSFVGAIAILTPLPAVIAAVLAIRAHRRGEPWMLLALGVAVVCTALGTWRMFVWY